MHTCPWLTKRFHCNLLLLPGKIKPCCFSYRMETWLQFHPLNHNKRQLLWGKTAKSNTEGGVEHTGGECLSVGAFLHPWVSVYLCVQLWLESEEGGWSVPGERNGLCPAAFGTKGLLLLCMLAVSVGDKVWSWEIRSGPANETHAKDLHGKPPLSTSHFYFEAFHSLQDITSLSTTSACLCIYMNRQTRTISSHQSIHLQPSTFALIKVKMTQGLIKVILG